MRNQILPACVAAAALGAGAFGPHAIAQSERTEAQREAERERAEAQREAERERAEADRERAEARRESLQEQLERAREQMEEAAREVAELSAEFAAPYVDFGGQWIVGRRRATLGINPENTELGVRVAGVTPSGPAADAGVEIGDVIVAIDGAELADERESGGSRQSPSELLVAQLQNVDPGETVTLRLSRDGQERDVAVETGHPSAYSAYVRPPRPPRPPRPRAWPGVFFTSSGWSDMEMVTLTPELGAYFGAEKGLLVVRGPESDALGLRDGDVILDIGGREPTSPEHAVRILGSFEQGETLKINVMRRQQRQTLELTVPDPATIQ